MIITREQYETFEWTKQNVANYVLEHAKQQNEKAVNDLDACQYHIEDKACFIGCLIPVHEYSTQMEKVDVSIIKKDFSFLKIVQFDTEFLINLQAIHDEYKVDQWEEELNNFYIDHNLEL